MMDSKTSKGAMWGQSLSPRDKIRGINWQGIILRPRWLSTLLGNS